MLSPKAHIRKLHRFQQFIDIQELISRRSQQNKSIMLLQLPSQIKTRRHNLLKNRELAIHTSRTVQLPDLDEEIVRKPKLSTGEKLQHIAPTKMRNTLSTFYPRQDNQLHQFKLSGQNKIISYHKNQKKYEKIHEMANQTIKSFFRDFRTCQARKKQNFSAYDNKNIFPKQKKNINKQKQRILSETKGQSKNIFRSSLKPRKQKKGREEKNQREQFFTPWSSSADRKMQLINQFPTPQRKKHMKDKQMKFI